MSRTYIVTVEVTFAVEAPSLDDALDRAHDHITWQGLNEASIESVAVELFEDKPEYGNESACGNCGDEWDTLDERKLCRECSAVLDATEVTS